MLSSNHEKEENQFLLYLLMYMNVLVTSCTKGRKLKGRSIISDARAIDGDLNKLPNFALRAQYQPLKRLVCDIRNADVK